MFPYNFQQSSSNVSSQHVLGFIFIDKFSIELHTFYLKSRFVPYQSYSKIGKNLDTLAKFSAYVYPAQIGIFNIPPKLFLSNLG